MEPGKASASPPQIFLWLLGFLGILGVASWFRSQPNTPSQQAVETAQARDRTDRNRSNGENEGDIPTGVVAITETPEAKAKRERAQKRRQAIQRFRKAGAAWLAFGTFLIVLCYTVIAENQWKAMTDTLDQVTTQTNLAQKHIEQTDRAWVGLEDRRPSHFAVTFSKSAVRLNAGYKIKNFGSSPALQTYSFLSVAPGLASTEALEAKACEGARKFAEGTIPLPSSLKTAKIGAVLFPRDDHSEAGTDSDAPYTPDIHTVYAVGCIVYKDQFGWHRTRFCWEVEVDRTKAPILSARSEDVFLCGIFNDAE